MLTVTLAANTAKAATTTYVYNDRGLLQSITDPVANTTSYTYTAAGQIKTTTDPLSQVSTRHYDLAGRLTRTVDRNGREATYQYDSLDQLRVETWLASDGVTPIETRSFTYNARGLLTNASNSVGGYVMNYDALGQVDDVVLPSGVTMDFGYDLVGNRTSVSDSLGGSQTSDYDAAGNLIGRDGTLGEFTQTFDLAGRRQTLDRTGGALSEYTYDELGRVNSITHSSSNLTSDIEYAIGYDEAGQLTSITDHGVTRNYTYDLLGQLTQDSANSGTTYEYDDNGNREDAGFVVGGNNQYATDGVWEFTYDAEGNLTEKASPTVTWTYHFDHRNQLTKAERKNSATQDLELSVEYKYDAWGNRVERRLDSNGDDTVDSTEKYFLDGWNPAKAGSLGTSRFDVWSDVATSSSGSLTTRYLHGDGIDELLAWSSASGPRWNLSDHLGSVRDIVDAVGTSVGAATHDAFGNTLSTTGETSRYGWTGREKDVETGLQTNRARWYDPTIARWISQDPIGFDAGDSNLYRYATNRPAQYTDPSGLDYVTAEGRVVYWVPESDNTGVFGNLFGRVRHNRIAIGVRRTSVKSNEFNDDVELSDTFGGGVRRLTDLTAAVSRYEATNWGPLSGNQSLRTGRRSETEQTSTIKFVIELFAPTDETNRLRKESAAAKEVREREVQAAIRHERWKIQQGLSNPPDTLAPDFSLYSNPEGYNALLQGVVRDRVYEAELRTRVTGINFVPILPGERLTTAEEFWFPGGHLDRTALIVAPFAIARPAQIESPPGGLAWGQRLDVSSRQPTAPRTGTVWDRIRPTREVWPGTEIPRSFVLTTQNGQRVWVHGNATEHLAERVVGVNGPRMRLELGRVVQQSQLTSLEAAINEATRGGVRFNEKIRVGGWELIFRQPRNAGELPALTHALPLE